MSFSNQESRGMYFEQFEVGQRMVTAGRTVTETDVVNFAGLSGDFNQMHLDAEYSKNTPFGKRVAHGLLGLAIASGLAVQTGFLEGTVIAFREVGNWKFINPIFIGDTIRVEMEVQETKSLRRIGGGKVVVELAVLNQQDEVLMRGTWSVLVASQAS